MVQGEGGVLAISGQCRLLFGDLSCLAFLGLAEKLSHALLGSCIGSMWAWWWIRASVLPIRWDVPV